MRKARAEKIGVVVMFILVLVVFSFAERDTQKIIRQQSKTAGSNRNQKELNGSEIPSQTMPPLLTRN